QNMASLGEALDEGEAQFAFLYTAGLDGLMHDVTRESPRVDDKLRWYEGQVRSLLERARRRSGEVRFALFSDHGMASVRRVVDLMPRVERTGLTFGRDYAAVYDSTMLRFWFLTDGAESRVRDALVDSADGRWLRDEELRAYGTY